MSARFDNDLVPNQSVQFNDPAKRDGRWRNFRHAANNTTGDLRVKFKKLAAAATKTRKASAR